MYVTIGPWTLRFWPMTHFKREAPSALRFANLSPWHFRLTLCTVLLSIQRDMTVLLCRSGRSLLNTVSEDTFTGMADMWCMVFSRTHSPLTKFQTEEDLLPLIGALPKEGHWIRSRRKKKTKDSRNTRAKRQNSRRHWWLSFDKHVHFLIVYLEGHPSATPVSRVLDICPRTFLEDRSSVIGSYSRIYSRQLHEFLQSLIVRIYQSTRNHSVETAKTIFDKCLGGHDSRYTDRSSCILP
jgi:hypothetical protein